MHYEKMKKMTCEVMLRNKLGIESISRRMTTGRLYCFGSVERKDDKSRVKHVKYFEVESREPIVRAKKTWDGFLKKDLESERNDKQYTVWCGGLLII